MAGSSRRRFAPLRPSFCDIHRHVYFGVALVLAATAAIAKGKLETRPEASGSQSTQPVGQLIRVPLPITGNVDRKIKAMVQRALAKFPTGDPPPVLIFYLDPVDGRFGKGSDFSRALSLALFLSGPKLSGVKTVAYVPQSIQGHGVLVAIACQEIVASPDAEIGDAGLDEPPHTSISPTILSGYEQIAKRRRTVPVEVALGLIDEKLEVLRVETEVSVEFVLREDLDALRDRRVVQATEVLFPSGELGHFNGREGRKLGFVKYLATDLASVAQTLGLSLDAVKEDASLRDGQPVRLELTGPITPQTVSLLKSMLQDQMRTGSVNFICLHVESGGGSLEDSTVLANYLAELNPGRVRTAAYIPVRAAADAALVALACDQVVMHPDAVLGGGIASPNGKLVAATCETIRTSLAKKKFRDWSIIAALIDPHLKVYRYQNKKNGRVRYFSEEEAAEQVTPEDWQRGEIVTIDDMPLEVDGRRAQVLGLAGELAENFAAFKQLYGLEADPRLVEPSWADFLIEALASPVAALLLMVIGGSALYVETQLPGIGIGGFVAGVAFLLLFWIKALNGTAGWLEVLLFLGGFTCLLLEIFILPGFGIFGLGGGLMIIVSLVLTSQTFVFPTNSDELLELRNSMLVVAGAGIGTLLIVMVLRNYLPRTAIFDRLVLSPPQEDEPDECSIGDAVLDGRHLVGSRGVAATQLTPSGKARIGQELIDVIAQGEVIDRGSEVVVVEVHSSRILVREVAC